MKDKWQIWENFDNWRLANANRLSRDYDKLKEQWNDNMENISYTEYVSARWQRNEL